MISENFSWPVELRPHERQELRKGKLVCKTIDHAVKPWPETWHFALLKCSPIEAMAAFSDYERQSEYVPGMLQAKISKHLSPLESEINYILKAPWPVNRSNYTTHDLMSLAGPNHFRIQWTMVKAEHSKDIRGSIDFQIFEGTTLMSYNNLVEPSSVIAGIFKAKALQAMEKSSQAIVNFLNGCAGDEGLEEKIVWLKKILN